MMRLARWLALAPVLAAVAVLAVPGTAAGHGLLQRSDPPANAALSAAPGRVELWFNEPLDPAFSTASVLGPSGKRVSGAPSFSPDGRRMTVPLEALPPGRFTVRWRVLSTVDGHTTGGAYGFTVRLPAAASGPPGPPVATTPAAPPTAVPEPVVQTDPPALPLILVRWVGYLAAVLLAGAALFRPAILAPALRTMDPDGARLLERVASARLHTLTAGTAAVLLASLILEVVLRTAALVEASLLEVLTGGHLWRFLLETSPGWSISIRAAMAGILLLPATPRGRLLAAASMVWVVLAGGLAALLGGPSGLAGPHLALIVLVAAVYGLVVVLLAVISPQVPDLRLPDLPWVPPLAAAGLLAGLPIAAHAWGSGPGAVLADWLHLLAASLWIGGLACLLVVLLAVFRDRDPGAAAQAARALVPHASRMAALGLAVLLLTGLYGARMHVPGWQAAVGTDYGRILLLKILLVVPLAALGAVNRFGLRPRIEGFATGVGAAAGAPRVLARFVGLVRGEVALGAGILLVVTALTVTPPARVTAPPPVPTALRLAGVAGEMRMVLTIDPARSGMNWVEVQVTGREGGPADEGTGASIRLTRLDASRPAAVVELAPRDPGRFVATGGLRLEVGWWFIEVVVRRPGRPEHAGAFPLRLDEAPSPSAAPDATAPVASDPVASDPAALRLLDRARTATAALRAWREVEQIADGAGGAVLVHAEFVRPDRVRYRTADGEEGVIVGTARYRRAGPGPWEQDVLPQPPRLEGPVRYLRDAQAVVLGIEAPCGPETCRLLLWEAPGRAAAFAAWVGQDSRLIHRLLMIAPAHYMTLRLWDFDVPIHINAPR